MTLSFNGFVSLRWPRKLALAAAFSLFATFAFTSLGAAQVAASPAPVPAGRQVILITGSTDGLGRELARQLGSTGAHIIIHGRNKARGDSVVDEITREGKGSARFYAADFASLKQVRALGQAIIRDYQRLDILINNAGIGSVVPEVRTLSEDGVELRFAVNYLSGYLLTRMLLPLVEKSAPSRIINVASGSQTPLQFDDINLANNYSGTRAYGQSKLAQIMFTFDLAEELKEKRVIVQTLHPSTYMNTSMIVSTGRIPRSTVQEGAAAVMQLVTRSDLASGQYFNVMNPARANAQAYDLEARAKLRALSAQLTGGR
jgi:NAD(P)-dependent dehydrogenase (short-subunit alcohol dehydrogenase family)